MSRGCKPLLCASAPRTPESPPTSCVGDARPPSYPHSDKYSDKYDAIVDREPLVAKELDAGASGHPPVEHVEVGAVEDAVA